MEKNLPLCKRKVSILALSVLNAIYQNMHKSSRFYCSLLKERDYLTLLHTTRVYKECYQNALNTSCKLTTNRLKEEEEEFSENHSSLIDYANTSTKEWLSLFDQAPLSLLTSQPVLFKSKEKLNALYSACLDSGHMTINAEEWLSCDLKQALLLFPNVQSLAIEKGRLTSSELKEVLENLKSLKILTLYDFEIEGKETSLQLASSSLQKLEWQGNQRVTHLQLETPLLQSLVLNLPHLTTIHIPKHRLKQFQYTLYTAKATEIATVSLACETFKYFELKLDQKSIISYMQHIRCGLGCPIFYKESSDTYPYLKSVHFDATLLTEIADQYFPKLQFKSSPVVILSDTYLKIFDKSLNYFQLTKDNQANFSEYLYFQNSLPRAYSTQDLSHLPLENKTPQNSALSFDFIHDIIKKANKHRMKNQIGESVVFTSLSTSVSIIDDSISVIEESSPHSPFITNDNLHFDVLSSNLSDASEDFLQTWGIDEPFDDLFDSKSDEKNFR
jgi:hypothetical protein